MNITITQPAPVNVTLTNPGGPPGVATFPAADGLPTIYRPVSGKFFVRDRTTGLYHELSSSSELGANALQTATTGVLFNQLPA